MYREKLLMLFSWVDGNRDQLMIIEMKQWNQVRPSQTQGEVETPLGGGWQSTLILLFTRENI